MVTSSGVVPLYTVHGCIVRRTKYLSTAYSNQPFQGKHIYSWRDKDILHWSCSNTCIQHKKGEFFDTREQDDAIRNWKFSLRSVTSRVEHKRGESLTNNVIFSHLIISTFSCRRSLPRKMLWHEDAKATNWVGQTTLLTDTLHEHVDMGEEAFSKALFRWGSSYA